jgi:hypothetical protein
MAGRAHGAAHIAPSFFNKNGKIAFDEFFGKSQRAFQRLWNAQFMGSLFEIMAMAIEGCHHAGMPK